MRIVYPSFFNRYVLRQDLVVVQLPVKLVTLQYIEVELAEVVVEIQTDKCMRLHFPKKLPCTWRTRGSDRLRFNTTTLKRPASCNTLPVLQPLFGSRS